MTEALVWLWLAGVADMLSLLLFIATLICGVMVAGHMILISETANGDEIKDRKRRIGKIATIAVCLGVTLAVIPSKTVLLAVSAASAGRAAASTDLGSKAYEALEAVLNRVKKEAGK